MARRAGAGRLLTGGVYLPSATKTPMSAYSASFVLPLEYSDLKSRGGLHSDAEEQGGGACFSQHSAVLLGSAGLFSVLVRKQHSLFAG